MKVHLDNLVAAAGNNNRELDPGWVKTLAGSIARFGLLTSITARKAAKVDKVQTFTVMAGFHREGALRLLRGLTDDEMRKLGTRVVDGVTVPGKTFDEHFPEGMLDVVVVDSDVADAAVAVENTARKDYTQPELCVIVWDLDSAGIDQHEIAARLTMNQGRISEFLALHKAIPQAHDAWGDGHVTMRDMLALATLSEAKQKEHLAKLIGGAGDGDAEIEPASKEGRRAKAAARKGLLGDAKETRRSYANAGKPSRKRLTTLGERIATVAKSGSDAEKNLFTIIDKTFAFVDGRVDEKTYKKWLQSYNVSDIFTDPEPEKKEKAKKAAKEAKKAEKKPAKKAAKKAEKKPAEKKPAEKKPAKAEKKPAKKAEKKPAKKAAKKAEKKPTKAAKKKPPKAIKPGNAVGPVAAAE